MDNAFGATLREMRAQLGLSQLALAEAIGSTQRHVSFLETGRARPSQAMVTRLVSDLRLSAAQRAALFDASGFANPFRPARPTADRMAQVLDMLDARVLAHWPFPAFVLDAEWNVLRANAQAAAMFAGAGTADNAPVNLLTLFLSPVFRALVENWKEASTALYFRLQGAAESSALVSERFAQAKAQGLFDHIPSVIRSSEEIPIFVPIVLRQPQGPALQITSLVGRLASTNDAAIEGFEVELMIPVDAQSESCLLRNLPAAS